MILIDVITKISKLEHHVFKMIEPDSDLLNHDSETCSDTCEKTQPSFLHEVIFEIYNKTCQSITM